VALLRWRDEPSRERRRRAGKGTVEYGAYGAWRWQSDDVPAAYMPVAQPANPAGAPTIMRGYRAGAVDGWARITLPWLRLEMEAAWLTATVDQPSLIPGVLLHEP